LGLTFSCVPGVFAFSRLGPGSGLVAW
jgi:hypothetical protein